MDLLDFKRMTQGHKTFEEVWILIQPVDRKSFIQKWLICQQGRHGVVTWDYNCNFVVSDEQGF